METTLSTESLKIFATLLKCLNKMGSEVTLHAYSHYLQLSSLNKTKSTFVKVKCYSSFFQSYSLNTSSSDSETTTCRVAIGPLYEVFKQKSRSISNSLSTASPLLAQSSKLSWTEQSSLLSIQHGCPDQVDTIYTLHMLTSKDPLLIPLDILPSTTSSSFTVTPSLVTQWLSHFLPKQEEVTMICSRHGVTLKSFSDIDTNPSLHTVLQTPTSVFESYHFHVQDEKTDPKEWDDVTLELTFNLKDFKGLLSFADSMNLPISALFKGPGMPILFSVTLPSATTTSTTSHSRRSTASSSDLMNLEFIIATVQPFTSSSSSSSSSTHPVPLYPFSTTSSFTSMLPNGTPVSHVSASHVSATPGGSLDTTPLRPAATPASVTAFPFGPDTNEIVPGTPPDQEQTWETFF